MKEVERHFRPEFLNRVDDIIMFRQLSREDLKAIVDIEMAKVRGRLAGQGLELVVTDEAKEFLIDQGFNPDFGARPLRRAIEHLVEDHISEELLRGSYKGLSLHHDQHARRAPVLRRVGRGRPAAGRGPSRNVAALERAIPAVGWHGHALSLRDHVPRAAAMVTPKAKGDQATPQMT